MCASGIFRNLREEEVEEEEECVNNNVKVCEREVRRREWVSRSAAVIIFSAGVRGRVG